MTSTLASGKENQMMDAFDVGVVAGMEKLAALPKKGLGSKGLVGLGTLSGGSYGPFTHDMKTLSEIAPRGAYEPLRRLGENLVKKPPVTGIYRGGKVSKAR